MLSSIHRFVLEQCSSLTEKNNPRILDYGCGAGEIVEAGRQTGLDIHGVESFYEGGNTREAVRAKGLLGDRVRELRDDRIPFDDGAFDVIVCNQVFEHVADMEKVLREIHRVLATDGVFLCLFPSNDVIREGHCGIPLVHWFPRDSRLRYPYMLALRGLGLGYFKKGKSRDQWSRDFLNWLDAFTFYRSHESILEAFGRYFEVVQQAEDVYVRFRLIDRGLSTMARHSLKSPFRQISGAFCRRFSGLVLKASRPHLTPKTARS